MSATQATSDSLPGTDATFEAEITSAGKFLLSELNLTLDSVIGYLNPTTRDCHADSDDDSDSDRRDIFVLDWDFHVRDPASPRPRQRDLTPATAFKYNTLDDSMNLHMLKNGDAYRGTIQVLLIRTVDVVGQPDLMIIKVYGNEPQDWHAEWCTDCNTEDAVVYFECGPTRRAHATNAEVFYLMNTRFPPGRVPTQLGESICFRVRHGDVAALMTAYVMLSRPATSALQSDDLQPVMLHATALNAHGVHHPAAAAPPSQPRRRSPSEARPERRDPPAGGSKHGGLAREDVRQVDIGDARRLSAKRWQDVAFMRSPVQGVDHLVSRPRIWTGQSQLRGNRSKVGESRSRWSGTVGGAMPGCEEEKTPYHVLAAPNALAKATLRAKISELQPTPRPPIRRPRLAPVVRFGFDHALMTGRPPRILHARSPGAEADSDTPASRISSGSFAA
ncbi:uncharacterized protein B0H18DRAFT_960052 [Fomitopsis serialis]|uniref:uncharacterized protein n=1 Tax=Fomitopsis serialis TaxID=139415 RepID=UPI002008BAC3|nr:uncharacterized protein B0H18DRAFT_960052 [Neoantrodia serialis]KAH9914049.1 hypothetical protein B0H18DRAFT_960052 [Neoantrodia serialis]